jgi:Fe-S-cluster containining protein
MPTDKVEIAASAEAEPQRMARRAQTAGLFGQLRRIYAGFPETRCENCARCCFESPGVFYIEYLHLLQVLAELSAQRRDELIGQAFRELFFSWIEPERTCIFLASGRCAIYHERPLACRLFGLVAAPERDRAEAEARLAAREEARRLKQLGVEVPEAVVQRSLVSCGKVRDARGNSVTLDAEAIAARVARLDAALLPEQVVIQEFCFRSLPERLGAAAFGEEAIAALRVQLLRRAQAGESVKELLALVLAQARPVGSEGKKTNHPRKRGSPEAPTR